MQAPTPLLQRALTAREQRNPALAESICNDILRANPRSFEATNLLGMLFLESGRLDAAEAALRSSISMKPKQPRAYLALADIRRAVADYDGAIDCYRQALKIDPKYVDAWFNLGIILKDVRLVDEAEKAFKVAIKEASFFAPARVALGVLYKEQNKLEEASHQLKRAVKEDPVNFHGLHNLGVVQRMQGKLDDAVITLGKVLKLNPDIPETLHVLSGVFRDKSDNEEAVRYLRRAIEVAPDYHAAHQELSNLLWEMGRKDEYLSSFAPAIIKAPDAPVLRASYSNTLLRQGEVSEAEDVLRTAFSHGMNDGILHDILGQCLVRQGKYEEALVHHNAAVASDARGLDWLLTRAKVLMYLGNYEEAILDLEPSNFDDENRKRLEQLRVAMIAQCYAEVGDPRGAGFNDYERFVKAMPLPVPDGYSSISAFNEELLVELEKLHTFEQHPIDQSLRANGTQTAGQLFSRPPRIIEVLKQSLILNFQAYIAELDDDPDHPFLCHKRDNIEFKGGWSVRLRDQGFHASHIHSEGWISSAYYVSLPPEVANGQSADKRAGHLHFGRPDQLPGEEGEPKHWIAPQEGYMAMFPSYIWHGTQPFSSEQPRVTVAMDVTMK